jgi:hypothetical protein
VDHQDWAGGLALELNPEEFADIYATFYDQFKPPFEPLMTDGKTIGVPRAGAGWDHASTPNYQA